MINLTMLRCLLIALALAQLLLVCEAGNGLRINRLIKKLVGRGGNNDEARQLVASVEEELTRFRATHRDGLEIIDGLGRDFETMAQKRTFKEDAIPIQALEDLLQTKRRGRYQLIVSLRDTCKAMEELAADLEPVLESGYAKDQISSFMDKLKICRRLDETNYLSQSQYHLQNNIRRF